MWISLAFVAIALPACNESVGVVFDDNDQWDDPSGWPGIGDGKILVTNSGDDTLSFLDPLTLEPVYSAPTGRIPAEREGPHHGAVSVDGASYFVGISNYVPGSGSGPHGSHGNGTVDGYLLQYDVVTNRRVTEVRVDKSPGDVRTTANGKYVLQSHFDLQSIIDAALAGKDPRTVLARLAVIDASTMEKIAMIPVCPAAHGIASSADSSEVYVSCWGSDELAVVSLEEPITADNTVDRYSVGPAGGDPTNPLYGPYSVSVDPATGEVWVSLLEGKALVVFDPVTRQFDDTRAIASAGSLLFGTFTDDGSTLFVPMQTPDGLLEVDPTDGSFSTLFFNRDECFLPHGVIVLPGQTTAGVVCEGDHIEPDISPGSVVRLNIETAGAPAIEMTFGVGIYPDDLVYLPSAN